MNLIDRIDSYLLSQTRRDRSGHYPSDVSSCTRKLWYSWNKTPESNPCEAGALWKMKIGDSMHDMIAGFLRDAKLDVVNEISFKIQDPTLGKIISGRVDNLFLENGEITGIEIKTSFGRGIVEIQKTQSPKREHIEQIACYMLFNGIKKYYLVYVGRDNAYRCQFEITLDPTGFIKIGDTVTEINKQYLLDRFAKIEKALENNIPPDREYKVAIKNGEIRENGFQKNNVKYDNDWQCIYCGYRNDCWKYEIEKYKDSDNSETFNKED